MKQKYKISKTQFTISPFELSYDEIKIEFFSTTATQLLGKPTNWTEWKKINELWNLQRNDLNLESRTC